MVVGRKADRASFCYFLPFSFVPAFFAGVGIFCVLGHACNKKQEIKLQKYKELLVKKKEETDKKMDEIEKNGDQIKKLTSENDSFRIEIKKLQEDSIQRKKSEEEVLKELEILREQLCSHEEEKASAAKGIEELTTKLKESQQQLEQAKSKLKNITQDSKKIGGKAYRTSYE